MTGSERPKLAPRARLVRDRVTGRAMLLYPERGLALNETAEQIVRRLDGAHTIDEIAAEIAASASAPIETVRADVIDLVHALRSRALIEGTVSIELRPSDRLALPEGEHPYTLIAELTYRCPLRCPYCSNPTELAASGGELSEAEWSRVLSEAAELGVMQVHFTGGEPLVRSELETLIRRARALELYTSVITSGVPLDRDRVHALRDAGLDHVQLSVQDASAERADRIAGRPAHARKLEAAAWIRDAGLPLTMNVVLHRANLAHVPELITLAEQLGAQRLELANAQYLGWALDNRDALLPTREAIDRAFAIASEARARLAGRMEIVFVTPDYVADRPRACMDGWARRYVHVSPDGLVLPCHAAHTITSLAFERVTDRSLADIWKDSPGLRAFRGDAWMPEPCASCDRKALDLGGCRCQAFRLTGDARATDPACSLAPHHELVAAARLSAGRAAPSYVYRTTPRVASR